MVELQKSFCLVYIYGGDRRDVQDIQSRLSRQLEIAGGSLSVVEPNHCKSMIPEVYSEIRRSINSDGPKKTARSGIWIGLSRPGTEPDPNWNSERLRLLALLNEQRTWLHKAYGGLLILHLPDEWWRTTPEAAPDLWQLRAKSFLLPVDNERTVLIPMGSVQGTSEAPLERDIEKAISAGNLKLASEVANMVARQRRSELSVDPTNFYLALESARANEQLAKVLLLKGEGANALRAYKSAILVRQDVQKAFPGGAKAIEELARVLEQASELSLILGDIASAQQLAKDAVGNRRVLAPEGGGKVIDLIRSLRAQASIYATQRDYNLATQPLLECLALADVLLMRPGSSIDFDLTELRSWVHGDLGDLYLASANDSAAETEFAKNLTLAERTQEMAYKANISVSVRRQANATLHAALARSGDFKLRRGQIRSALGDYERDVKLCRNRVREFGDSSESLRDLSIALNRTAATYKQLGDFAQEYLLLTESVALRTRLLLSAAVDYNSARELSRTLSRLSVACRNTGRIEEAIAKSLDSIEHLLAYVHEHAKRSVIQDLAGEIGRLESLVVFWKGLEKVSPKAGECLPQQRAGAVPDIDLEEIQNDAIAVTAKRIHEIGRSTREAVGVLYALNSKELVDIERVVGCVVRIETVLGYQ